MADLAGEALLGEVDVEIDVEVAFVKDGGNVVEVPLADNLGIVLEDRAIVLLGVPKTLVVPHALLVELIVGESHIHLDGDEEGELEVLLPFVDGEQGLLIIDVIFVI